MRANIKHFVSLWKSWMRLQTSIEIVASYSGEDAEGSLWYPQKVCTKDNSEKVMESVVILQFH